MKSIITILALLLIFYQVVKKKTENSNNSDETQLVLSGQITESSSCKEFSETTYLWTEFGFIVPVFLRIHFSVLNIRLMKPIIP